jgi:hypothetical protein
MAQNIRPKQRKRLEDRAARSERRGREPGFPARSDRRRTRTAVIDVLKGHWLFPLPLRAFAPANSSNARNAMTLGLVILTPCPV